MTEPSALAAALRESSERLTELDLAMEKAQRRLRTYDRYLRRRLLYALTMTIISSVVVMVIDSRALQVLWLISTVLAAWLSGFVVAARRALAALLEEARAADEAERVALLTRLSQGATTHRDLWTAVAAGAALIGAVAAVFGVVMAVVQLLSQTS